jgi:hypothetical protein
MNMPLCFEGAPPNLGLAERDWYNEMTAVCTVAAQQHGIPVGPPLSPGCLVAKMEWSSQFSGSSTAECGAAFGWSRSCTATNIFVKKLKITLIDANHGQVVVETRSALQSTVKAVKASTALALCSAAFHGYPQPMKNESVDVELPDDS